MIRSGVDKRSRLIEAAITLTYRHGFGATSLADIAREADVPLGNVYYYFKTKDEIGEAIAEHRLEVFRAFARMLIALSPKERLEAFVQMTLDNAPLLAQSGCPFGTFCSELHKYEGILADKASALLEEPLTWMEVQFQALGKKDESRALAVHLLSALQGVSVLAHSFHDPGLVAMEAAGLKEWIRGQ
jgi:AcrR family transcriptional regulator